MDTTRLIITLHVVADVDLEKVAARDGLDPAKDNVLGHYAGQLASFLENEVNRLPRHARGGHRAGGGDCNALFCILSAHEGDQHVDATGHTWSEATLSAPAVARVITAAQDEAEPDTWSSASRQNHIDTGDYLPAAETQAQR